MAIPASGSEKDDLRTARWPDRIKDFFLRHMLLVLIGAMALVTMPLMAYLAGPGLDPSWKIGVAIASLERMRFGVDIIFTHGPLDFLELPFIIDQGQWMLSALFALFRHFLFYLSLYLLLRQVSAKWYHAILLIPVLWYTTSMIDYLVPITFTMFVSYMMLKEKQDWYDTPMLLAISLALSASSLIKFSVLPVSAASILIALTIAAAMRKHLVQMAGFLASYLIFMLALWILVGQQVGDIPAYLQSCLQLSGGYNDAMFVQRTEVNALIFLSAVFATYVIASYSLLKKNKVLMTFILLNGVVLATSYKHGVVRQEHSFYMEFMMLFGIFLVLALRDLKIKEAPVASFLCFTLIALATFIKPFDNISEGLAFVCLCASLFAFLAMIMRGESGISYVSYLAIFSCATLIAMLIIASNAQVYSTWEDRPDSMLTTYGPAANYILDPSSFAADVAQEKMDIRYEYDINKSIYGPIGGNTVDVFPHDAAICWAYGLNWSPRPVFQSYTAYTPDLDRANAQYYAGINAPKYVIFSLESIDGRYPIFDEPQTLRTLLYEYEPVSAEGPYILLAHTRSVGGQAMEPLGRINATLGESIDVPRYNGSVYARIYIKKSPIGEIKSIVYKADPMFVRFKLDDGRITAKSRILPAMAQDGFYVSSYVNDRESALGMFERNGTQAIQAMEIDPQVWSDYSSDIWIEFFGVKNP